MVSKAASAHHNRPPRPPLSAPPSLKWYTLTAAIVLAVVVGITIRPSSHAATTYPTTPPAQICGDAATLTGPSSAPAGAITVAAGNNSAVNFGTAGATYYFATGTHTLGSGAFDQITPGNNATLVGAPGAILDGQGLNHYAITGNATGVTVKYLTIQNFGVGSSSTTPSSDDNNEGVVNHNAGHNWIITNNTVQYDAGAGVFVGSGDNISYNCLYKNAQYGFSAYEPTMVTNVTLDHNEISYNDTYDWEAHISGCGCTGGGKFWDTRGAIITNNYIHHNASVGVWADTNNTGFDVEGNYISDNNDAAFEYEISYNFLVKNNTFIRNSIGGGASDPGFAHAAVYISESGSDSRVPGNYGTSSDITGNLFQDNWGGVVLWENANRYCSSSANTSGGDCTLVNPSMANLTTCGNASLLATTPYINDCRWKTQNVHVYGNTFQMQPSAISAQCTLANSCGLNALFSEYGTYPPYTAWVVPGHISSNQNNVFSSNTYTGPWNFDGFNQGENVTYAQWTAGFNDTNGSGMHFNAQDAGSTFNATASPTINPTPTPSGTATPTPTPTPTPTSTPTPTLTPTPTSSPSGNGVGDINHDGTVNIFDLSILLSHWGANYAAADLNTDATVNVFDLSILLSHWGQSGSGTPTPTPTPTPSPGGITFNSCISPTSTIPMNQSNPQTGVNSGNFYVTNDNWNSGAGSAQTLYVCNYNNWYVQATEPNTTSVKTYPNVHQDFINWGTGVSPLLSNYPTITSTYAQTSPHTGIYEWAYDMWFNGVASGNSTEVMIWTENFNQAPAGSKRTTFTDGGVTYDVWSDGTACAANGCYIAFVPRTTTTSGTVNIKNFMNFLINTQGWLNSTTTVGQIDYGVEICSTNAVNTKFELNNFSLTAQ